MISGGCTDPFFLRSFSFFLTVLLHVGSLVVRNDEMSLQQMKGGGGGGHRRSMPYIMETDSEAVRCDLMIAV
jgi:hypothetical protein